MAKKPLPSYDKVYQNYTKMRMIYFVCLVIVVVLFLIRAASGDVVVFSAPNVWAAIISLLRGIMPWYGLFAIYSLGCSAYFKDIVDREESLDSFIANNQTFSEEEIGEIKQFKRFFFYPWALFLAFWILDVIAKRMV